LRKGKGYSIANPKALSKMAAEGLGMNIVDTFANRSFKIRKSSKRLEPNPNLEKLRDQLVYKFRQSKKNPGVFVEKTQYAIDSLQEKKAIPFTSARLRRLGLVTPRKPRRKKTKSFITSRSTARFL